VVNAAGVAKASLTVELWEAANWELDQDTSGSAARTASDTSDADGRWNFDSQDATKTWLVNVIDGTKNFILDGRNKIQLTDLDLISDLFVDTISEHTSANGVVIDGVTLKDGGMTVTADFSLGDAVDLALGSASGGDALIRWSTGDSSNHAMVVAVGDSSQALHITDKAAVATDWNISATTHPNVYIHSNTTPATDYLRLGDHDGTTAYVDVVGGTTLAFEIAGTSEFTLTATAGDFQTNNIVTGGIVQIDVDGSAENAAGSLTMGAGNDAGIFFDGTDLVVITNGSGASGIIFDSEDDTVEIKGSGTLQATFDTGGLNIVSGDTYQINGTAVLSNNTLGTGVITASLTTVGALDSGSISTGFGAIDNGTSNITTGGIIKLDVDGSAENAAGALTLGAGNDAGLYFDGTDFVMITNGAGASGIILDAEDDTVEIKGSGTLQATFSTSGLNVVSGDAYSIAGTSVLNATTLGSGVTASSLTSVGTLSGDLQLDGDLDFAGPQSITTSSGDLTLAPASGKDVLIPNSKGLVVGHTAQVNVKAQLTELQVLGTSPTDAGIVIGEFSANSDAPELVFAKSYGGSIGSFGMVTQDDELGNIRFMASDDGDLDTLVAQIRCQVDDATPADADIGAELIFFTAPGDGGGGIQARQTIAPDGGIFFGNLLAAGASTDVNINGSNELHSVTSSRAFKDNERSLDVNSALIYNLTVRTFDWSAASGSPGLKDFGIIAEDAYSAIPDIVNMRRDRARTVNAKGETVMEETGSPKPYSIRNSALIMLMLDQIQRLHGRITALGG
jgi:hypothetical protein